MPSYGIPVIDLLLNSMNKGQTITGLMIGIATAFAGATWLWNSWLSISTFNDHATLSGLSASVEDIKSNTEGLPEIRNEIQFLAAQRGYKPELSIATST